MSNALIKIKVDWDERYPDFIICDNGVELEVTEEEHAFVMKACIDYGKAQQILSRARKE